MPDHKPEPEATAASHLVVGQMAHLRHAVVTSAGTIKAGTAGRVRSLHRLHARLLTEIDGRALTLKVPLEALEP